jgi:HD-GYP domain-containing protein (c-di-GMP phosphodiesterase class II)
VTETIANLRGYMETTQHRPNNRESNWDDVVNSISKPHLTVVGHPGEMVDRSATEKHAPSAFDNLIEGLHRFLEIDPHGRRTAWLSHKIAVTMGIDHERTQTIAAAAATHDVGKLFIPEIIREKPGRLTSHESTIMRYHTALGRDLLTGMHKHPGREYDFEVQAAVALTHHERWDGSGYPLKLRGTEIPLEARIVSVADVFDALTATRSYKPAWPVRNAINLIREEREMQFDPACVDALCSLESDLIQNWGCQASDILARFPIPVLNFEGRN